MLRREEGVPDRALCLLTLPEAVEDSWNLVLLLRPTWGPILVIANIILDRSSRGIACY